MTERPPRPAATPREDRLKAALKANMARRKAQVRAREQDGRAGEADGIEKRGDEPSPIPDSDGPT